VNRARIHESPETNGTLASSSEFAELKTETKFNRYQLSLSPTKSREQPKPAHQTPNERIRCQS